jgi:hypothetical protein
MTPQLKKYKSECEDFILSIHGIDLKGCAIDEEQLEDSMIQGEHPIDIAIAFDPENYLEEE